MICHPSLSRSCTPQPVSVVSDDRQSLIRVGKCVAWNPPERDGSCTRSSSNLLPGVPQIHLKARPIGDQDRREDHER
eukprot:1322713-Amorphochlora_amoeboformis.AAC.1